MKQSNEISGNDSLLLLIFRETLLGFNRMVSVKMPDDNIYLCGGEASTYFDVSITCFSYKEGIRKANLSDPRHGGFTMTPLNDRYILISGGDKADYQTVISTELYDTLENKSNLFVNMLVERSRHTATLIKSDEVLLVGGNIDFKDKVTDSWQVLNTKSGLNVQTGLLNKARYRHKDQLLSNGDVLVIGGENLSDSIDDIEIFNNSTRTFSLTAKLKESRSYHSVIYFDDNNIYIIGGINKVKGKDLYLSSIERYDKSRNVSEIVAYLDEPRAHINAKKISDKEILLCGGVNGNTNPRQHLSDCSVFDIESKKISFFANLTKPRIYSTADLTSDGQFLLCGGNSLNILYNDCETLDLKTKTSMIRFPRLF